jgi:hypothetical protein
VSTITVTKNEYGKLDGFTEKDKRAYALFRKAILELEPGELFTLETWFPREGWRHRKHFAMLAAVYDAQETFQDSEQLRMWLQVGAGHCDFVPGPDGQMVAIPKSIKFSAIDDADFADHHEKVKAFLRSERARRYLWPHLDDAQTHETVEILLGEFETE